MITSNNTAIQYESELVRSFGELVADEQDVEWNLPSGGSLYERISWLELSFEKHSCQFQPLYYLQPSVPELESILAGWQDIVRPLLVVPNLSPRLLEFCRKKRLAAVDLNGRLYVRTDDVLIDRQSQPGRNFRFELEPRNIFVGKSLRIIRSLLTNRDRTWTQSELVSRAEASSGLVSRIVQHLVSQGFIEKLSAREFRLCDPLSLIDAWSKADEFPRRNAIVRYTTLGSNPLELATQLHAWAEEHSVSIAFTQWIGGWLRQPYTEPVIASAYVGRLPEPAILERLDLRPVNDAGKLWLYVPEDEGVFLETQTSKDLTLASDAQIYVDLQNTGLRGPEQADALRDWEGFCRP